MTVWKTAWTFETRMFGRDWWQTSSQRFENILGAQMAAGDWLAVNATNGVIGEDCEVRLTRAQMEA